MADRVRDLHVLPKVRDGWTYLYVEHARIDKGDQAIVLHDADGRVPVPCASLSVLMMGPGTTITHAAVRTLADSGCLIVWCGEEGVRFYAQGMGKTRSAANLLHQARMWAHPELRMRVVRKMYELRFKEPLGDHLTLRQIRGLEGVRVRQAYARASRETGVPWKGRSYTRDAWNRADPVNRALSAANSCLYGICHAAIVAAGFSPAIGFIHTGKMLSFVYDIADLYKTEITIPVAFRVTAEGEEQLETRVRHACRQAFAEARLLARIIPDVQTVLDVPEEGAEPDFDADMALPGGLWDPDEGVVSGGRNFAGEEVPNGRDHR